MHGILMRLLRSIPMFMWNRMPTDVAADFPGLTVILTHSSVRWQDTAISMATQKANVFIDLSGWLPKYFPPALVRATNGLLGALARSVAGHARPIRSGIGSRSSKARRQTCPATRRSQSCRSRLLCAPGGTRTPNRLIRSQMPYPLGHRRVTPRSLGTTHVLATIESGAFLQR